MRGHHPGRLWAKLCAGLLLCACGPGEHALEGSLTELVDLRYRKVEVHQSTEELSLHFLRPQGAGQSVVLRVTASLLGKSVDARTPLDLAEPDDLGQVRGRISRAVEDDPLTTFPLPRRGELVFARSLRAGTQVQGELRVTFENGIELASGRTVFGTFEATVQ